MSLSRLKIITCENFFQKCYIYIFIYISKHKVSDKPITRQYLLKKFKVNISTSITCLYQNKYTNTYKFLFTNIQCLKPFKSPMGRSNYFYICRFFCFGSNHGYQPFKPLCWVINEPIQSFSFIKSKLSIYSTLKPFVLFTESTKWNFMLINPYSCQ